MIKYEADDHSSVFYVDGNNDFTVLIGGHYVALDREGVTQLRAIIDQALNTSTEELEASE